jgi:putative transposase
VPVQRCTVHKHRNLLAHAPERLHDEITADCTEMIYAATPDEIAARRKAFIRKWRLKHSPVAKSLHEAGDRLFTFARLPTSEWKSARTTNAIERLHEELKRRIKPKPSCHPPTPPPCCSGHCLLQAKSTCAKSTVGIPWPARSPTSPVDLAA